MTSHKSGAGAVALAIASIIATILGTLLGAAVTLMIFRLQDDAALAAEERAQRRESYNEYIDAAAAYFQAQIDMLSDDAACEARASYNFEGGSEGNCIAWNSERLREERDGWYDAKQDLKVYGSDEILAIAQEIDAEIQPVNYLFLPFGKRLLVFSERADTNEDISEQQSKRDEALKPFNDAAARFSERTCVDTSVTPERCAAAFGKEEGSSTK